MNIDILIQWVKGKSVFLLFTFFGIWVGSPKAPFSPGLSLPHTISLSHPNSFLQFLERRHVGVLGLKDRSIPWGPRQPPPQLLQAWCQHLEPQPKLARTKPCSRAPGICRAPNASKARKASPRVGYTLLASRSCTPPTFFSLTSKLSYTALWMPHYKVKKEDYLILSTSFLRVSSRSCFNGNLTSMYASLLPAALWVGGCLFPQVPWSAGQGRSPSIFQIYAICCVPVWRNPTAFLSVLTYRPLDENKNHPVCRTALLRSIVSRCCPAISEIATSSLSLSSPSSAFQTFTRLANLPPFTPSSWVYAVLWGRALESSRSQQRSDVGSAWLWTWAPLLLGYIAPG